MTLEALLARLESADINLRRSAEGLAVSGDRAQLDASMVEALRAHKSQLMELVGEDGSSSPPRIRPEMLPLIRRPSERASRKR